MSVRVDVADGTEAGKFLEEGFDRVCDGIESIEERRVLHLECM